MTRAVERILERPLLMLLLVAVIPGAIGIADHGLWTADEPRAAAIGKEMWKDASFAVPRLNGQAFLEKPPLYWWAQTGIYAIAGKADAGLARCASALFALATLLLTYWLARRWLSARVSLLGCLLLLTTVLFVMRSHWIIVDDALVFATTGALAAFAASLDSSGLRRAGALLLFYLFLAAAFLAKGTVGIGVPAIGVLVYLVASRRLGKWLGWHLLPGILIVAAPAFVWLLAVYRSTGPEGVKTFLFVNQLGRFAPWATGYSGGHENPIWYYLGTLPADFLPWTPLLIVALFAAFRRGTGPSPREQDATRFLLATSVPVFLVLSLAGTKRGLYLFPIFPSLALLTASWLANASPGRTIRWTGRAVVGIAIVFGLAAPLALALRPALAPAAAHRFLPENWLRVLATTAGFVALGVPLFLATRTRSMVDSWIARSALFAVGVAAALAVWLPVIDRSKSFEPFAQAVVAKVPPDARLFTIDPDETTLGILSFYTGRHVGVAPRAAALPPATKENPLYIVTRGRYGKPERTPGRVLVESRVGNTRVVRLIERP